MLILWFHFNILSFKSGHSQFPCKVLNKTARSYFPSQLSANLDSLCHISLIFTSKLTSNTISFRNYQILVQKSINNNKSLTINSDRFPTVVRGRLSAQPHRFKISWWNTAILFSVLFLFANRFGSLRIRSWKARHFFLTKYL